MQIALPSADEVAKLVAQYAYRYPQKAKVPVMGDGGERVMLPLLLGVPSGACRLPSGVKASPAWRVIVEGLLSQNLDGSAISEALVADCVLWPEPKTFALWRDRWPGLGGDVGLAVLRMVGGMSTAIEEPSAVEEPPAPIASLLEQHPRAVWRRLRPPGATFDVVIDTPDSVKFDAFTDAIGKSDADKPALVRDFAEACLLAPIGDAFDRFPGLAILVAAQARRLGGAQGEIALGEW